MKAASHPRQEQRLIELRSFSVLDTPREERFDNIVELAATICETPIAVINLIDERRQWFKAEIGLGVRETPLDTSICAHAILEPGLTLIHDTLADPRMRDNPLCIGDKGLRFYAGALLVADDGLPIGTLCVLDYEPRDLDARQRRSLLVLADQVMAQLRLRRELALAAELRLEIDHRVKNSLAMVSALLNLQARQSDNDEVITAINFARDRVAAIASIHDQLHGANAAGFVDIRLFAEQLASSLTAKTRRDVAITADLPSVLLPARNAINIGIILNELVTNALRHGFAIGEAGKIVISGTADDARLRVVVSDNGSGPPDEFDPAASKGLGMRLTLILTRQFGHELEWSRSEGHTQFAFEVQV